MSDEARHPDTLNIPGQARCLECDYQLRRLTEPRCPECGRKFDPDRAITMNLTGAPISQFRRRLLRCLPVWPINLLGLALVAYQFWIQRYDWDKVILPQSLTWCWGALAVLYLVVALLPGIAARIRPLPAALWPHRRRRYQLRLLPLLGVLAIIARYSNTPFYLAYRLSRPAMDRFARDMLAQPWQVNYPDRWVGLFWAQDIYARPHEVGFAIGTQSGGFVFAPQGNAGGENQEVTRQPTPLNGAWYLWQTNYWLPEKHRGDQRALLLVLAADKRQAARVIPALLANLSNDSWAREFNDFYGAYRDYSDAFPAQEQQTAAYPFPEFYEPPPLLRPDMRALVGLGQTAIPALSETLAHGTPNQRARVCIIFGFMGPDALPALPAIINALQDQEPMVREFAAWAICQIGPDPRAAAGALLAALPNDPAPWVRYNMVIALRQLHPDAAVALPVYVQYLQTYLPPPPAPLPIAASTEPSIHSRELFPERGRAKANEMAFHAIADYGADAAPLAPALAELFNKAMPVFLAEVNAKVSYSNPPIDRAIVGSVVDEVPKIFEKCGPAAQAAAPLFWKTIGGYPRGKPLPNIRALAAIAPHYPKLRS